MFWHPYYSFTDGTGIPVPPIPPVVPSGPAPSGGFHPWIHRLRRRRKPHEEQEVIQAVIEAVARRQAQALELDELKRLEELERELQLKAVEWDSVYLEMMNEERERLIHEEIGKLIRKKLQDDEAISLLLTTLI